MKRTKHLLAAGMIAVSCCSIANAQLKYTNSLVGATLIYSNAFTGGAVDINATVPTYVNPGAASFGGSSSASWDVVRDQPPPAENYYAYQDGTLGSRQETVLLTFVPVNGYIYTMSASLTFASQPPSGGWGSLGYGLNFPASSSTTGDPRFNQAIISGNPWALLNYAAQGGGAVLNDTAGHALGGVPNLMSALHTPYTVNFILDTTGAHWYSALYIGSTFVKDVTYATAPALKSAGYGQTATTAGAYKWNTFALYASRLTIVQEPVAGLVSPGHAFTNMIVVASATAPSCQWYFNTAPSYAGATPVTNTPDGRVFSSGTLTNSLVITNAQGSDAGYYFAVVTNTTDSVTSDIVSLAIPQSVQFTSQLPVTYTNIFSLYAGVSPQFSVATAGSTPIGYQWYTNGMACAGQTNATFTWSNVPLGMITNYCIATNISSASTSTVWIASVIAAPPAPYPTNLLALNPIGYWRLNEGPDDGAGDNGVVALDYLGGNDGIYTNAVLGVSGYSLTESGVTAAYFSSFANPDSDAFNIQGIDFGAPTSSNAVMSVTAWVRSAGSQTSGAGILAKGYGGAEQFLLDVSGGKYEFAVRDAAGTLHSATSSIAPSGNWDYLVGVCDEVHGNVTLYVNGVPAASATVAPGSGLLACGVPMTIGARSSSSTIGHNDLQFKGFVNDVALFKSALSTEQEVALYTTAGYSVPISYNPPPSTFVYQANKTLTIPASAFGATNLGYYWTDTTSGSFLGSGSISTWTTLDATLTIPNAARSLSGDVLQLVITNDSTFNSWSVTLSTPAPPVTLDYSDPILYTNYFNGGNWSVDGMPLTAANALVGGTNTTWHIVTNNPAAGYAAYADGTLGPLLDSVLLPFTARPGYIYTLLASLTFTVAPPAGGWGGLGFSSQFPTNSVVDPRVLNNWALLNMFANGNGAILYANSVNVGQMPNLMTALNTPYDIKLVLDTTAAQWSVALYVAGTFVTNYVYAAGNPAIASFGYTQTTTTGGAFKWNYIALSQEDHGAPPYLLAPLPPASVTVAADAPLSIPVSAFGSVPVGYYWSNTNTAALLGSGSTNNVDPLVANLSVADVPFGWNGNRLALVVTNAYGTNISLVSLTVTNPINPYPGPIQVSFSNGLLTLSWPTNLGWTLLGQTNGPGVGLGTNWAVVPGSTTITNLVVPVSPTNGSVFYRLRL